jgi:hypothetical protein
VLLPAVAAAVAAAAAAGSNQDTATQFIRLLHSIADV